MYDLYLMASDYAFLLGATGKKVIQSFASKADSSLEWELVAAGTFVKLKTKGDKFLRANGGVPPYRNSVTHDVPVLASNYHVVQWEVEVVRKLDSQSLPASRVPSPNQVPPARSHSPPMHPRRADSSYDPEASVPPPMYNRNSREKRSQSAPTEDFFPAPSEYSSSPSERLSPISSPPRDRRNAPSAGDAHKSLPKPKRPHEHFDSSDLPARNAQPSTQPLENADTADDYSSSSEASSPVPNQRSAQHRHRTTMSELPPQLSSNDDYDSPPSELPSPRTRLQNLKIDQGEIAGRGKASPRTPSAKSPSDVRRIFYSIAEDDGEVLAHDDETFGSFLFKGHSLQELTEQLQLETGIDEDIILCMRNPLTQKLYRMRLQLPPNKAPLSLVIVRTNSEFGKIFATPTQ